MAQLRFRSDRTFTIVQFTDIHWKDGSELDLKSRRAMETILDAENPDFVIFTGDLIFTARGHDGGNQMLCEDPIQALQAVVRTVEERAIPWALVFGNHDSEYGITRKELMNEALKHRYVMAEAGPEHIHGVGNYVLPIMSGGSDEPVALLYGFDSGEYSGHPNVPGYDWIRHDQIQWYIDQAQQWKHRKQGQVLPALAFFHIPLPEYQEVWDRETCYGHKYEDVCAPRLQTGLFSAMLTQGDVMGTFCGHDHVNDFWGELYGIRLHYGRATGYSTYGREGFERGARVIRLTEGQRSLETWLRLADGTRVEQQVSIKQAYK